jgi:hypothetical protein
MFCGVLKFQKRAVLAMKYTRKPAYLPVFSAYTVYQGPQYAPQIVLGNSFADLSDQAVAKSDASDLQVHPLPC